MELTPCIDFRCAALDGTVGEHASACTECARWIARLELRERALRDLPRIEVPIALDGAVVAALESGERQARAVRALKGLGRIPSPPALDVAVSGAAAKKEDVLDSFAERRSVPAVLERLVADELRDPAKARTMRFVGSLSRVAAPAELAERVMAELLAPTPPQRRFASLVLTLTASFVVAGAALLATLRARRPEYPFEVQHVASPADLGAQARGLFEEATSGITTLPRS